MRYTIRFIALVLFLSQTVQAQEFDFVEVPSWVKNIDIPNESAISKYDINAGYYLTLIDYQINLNKQAFYNREIRNVVSYSGITNASQISVVYDSSYQHLQIHHLYIWRKGEKIDRTADLSFELMNNEYNLDQGIYTGATTAYDILNDIRKDDLIDFAYSLIGDNPIFENEKYLFIPLDVTNPVDLYFVRILYPKTKDYLYECVDCDSLNVTIAEVDDDKQIEIICKDLKPLDIEDNIPTWFIPYRYFTLSSFASWRDVNNWAQNVFALEHEPDLNDVLSELISGQESTDEQINKVIKYVQNDIRYMGIESGIGSIKPFAPEQVVKQRFGDCKDKSLLLVSLLKKLGVAEAYPALVNTFWQHKVDRHFASNQVFNHCIVTFNYNDSTYWVDPTVALQGGSFKDFYVKDYGKALVIGASADSLQIMNPRKVEGGTNLIEELTVSSFSETAKLKITSSRYGFEADNRRALLEYYSIKDFSKQVADDLKRLFAEVNETEEVEVTDDIDKNTLALAYSYEVDGFWKDQVNNKNGSGNKFFTFKYEPLSLYQYFSESTCEDRKFDFEINYPLNLNCKMIFHFPKAMLIYDDGDIFDNEYFYYEESVEQLSERSFQIEYNFKVKSNCIKSDDYKKICEQINVIAKNLPVIIYFSK